ncbi:mRNAion factor 25 isoform X1 [Huso huso]|uniref:mRNAion factor 25 isoform X1 n=1 Tax=Huso huso TaxID=61971 RepID=A0ABR0Z5Q1_HUSHU
MSSRALRRLKGNPRGQEALQAGDPELETGEEEEETQTEPAKNTSRKAKKNKKQKNICNIYELINEAENETDKNCEVEAPAEEEHVESKLDPDNQEKKEKSDNEETEKQEETRETEKSSVSVKASKKKKKKKNKKTTAGDAQEEGCTDDIDSILETIENQNGLSYRNECSRNADTRPILYVEHRNLNPETELKRYFGARAVLGDQSRPRQRQRQFHRSTWMTTLKNTWPRFSKPGISMSLLETRDGVQYFTFEHSREYQQVQFKFLDAVESMDPNNIVLLLQMNPYHIDSLLQLSDVCRIQDDQEMAKDLIERALYSFECASHPVFSLTSGTSRLDYLRPENRAFYLSLYKHMMFLEKRGCPRTALEYCKLILSLDPDNDPLCMLLLLDFLSLRSREYSFLSRIYEEWEAHRNLSQLPNFAYSVGLCYYFLSQQEDLPASECAQKQQTADHLLQNALLMFPSVLMPLLEICAVEPDAAVSSHAFFGPRTQIGQPPALNELVALFVGRSHSLWKDPAVMLWLERNVKEVLQRVDANDPVVEEYEKKRKLRYQSAPRSIHRHVILSEIKEATAALPLEVTAQPVMGFDPLPPLDSVASYTRPERANRVATDESTLSLFLRSLLPNFNLQGGVRPEEDLEVAHAGRQLNQEVNRLMGAMRDMLANIQFQEPPREDNPERDEEEWD